MRSIRSRIAVAVTAMLLLVPVAAPALAQGEDDDSPQVILDWNQHALGAVTTAELPPAVQPLLLGFVHGAMYDAVVSIAGGYAPYLEGLEADPTASKVAAAAVAAHDTLVALFPDQAEALAANLQESLAMVPDGTAKDAGSAIGAAAAAAMMAAREGDGRGVPNPITPGTEPGQWRPVPPDRLEFPASWIAKVKPFFAASPDAYRTEGPAPLDSEQYATEFNEVKTLGAGEGSTRTADQDAMVSFWLGPTPQFSALERTLITEQELGIAEAARLLAIANMGAGEAAIGCFDDKYHWMWWRPMTAIMEAANDGNDATEPDPDWMGSAQPTPPYPDHPSGFNCLAGAHVGALQEFFGTDEMEFDLLNPDLPEPRHYTSFSQALEECIELRILHGLHFRSAEAQGAALGQKAAAAAAAALVPVG